MTQQQKKKGYEDTEQLVKIIVNLSGRKFKLSCGHHVTFGCHLGNNILIYNGKNPQIICSMCGY